MPIAEEYADKAAEYLSGATTESKPSKQLRDLHAKAAELLLQRLLRIDSVICPPDADAARAKRKEAVRFIQKNLDKIDALKEKVNSAAKEAEAKGSL